jgi:hypothetical protein
LVVSHALGIYSTHGGALRHVIRTNEVLLGVGAYYWSYTFAALINGNGSVICPMWTWSGRTVLLRTGPKF